MTEILRRMEKEIYDIDEYEKAIAWTKENCMQGKDVNSEELTRSKSHQKEWEASVKMAIICKDLMIGNDRLIELGFKEARGHNAIASGFQGQRQWTDHLPNGDFMEAINSSFDWNGSGCRIVATENDALNAVPMLFGHLITNSAQVFADVRTYWSQRL